MSYAIAKRVVLKESVCIVCGIDYGVPEQLLNSHRRVGGYHSCPNGHRQGWEHGSEHTKIKGLERDLAAEKSRLQAALVRENEERARANKLEADKKRLAKRASAGVCPCCNRTFKQLARHMAAKHPANS